MFGVGQRVTRGEIIRMELGESLDHVRRAAAQAAEAIGATVGPRVAAARAYASPALSRVRLTASNGWDTAVASLAPLVANVAERARQTRTVTREARSQDMRMKAMRNMMLMGGGRSGRLMKSRRPNRMMWGRKPNRNWPRRAMIIGGALGMMGMMIMRRRRQQQQWQEFDPGHTMERHEAMPTTAAGRATGEGAVASGTTGLGIAQVPGSTAGGKPSSTRVVAEEHGPHGPRKIAEERAPQSPRK